MNKLRIGIIGCGGIANNKHLPTLVKFPEMCSAVAFCDIVPERAIEACKKFGTENAKYYTDYKELLSDAAIDAVHVCTPNVTHSAIVCAAFEAGKHVLCEKPMAHDTESAQKMMDAWKKSGKKFTIGYQNRFRPEAQQLHAACAAGDLGEIYFAKAHAIRRRAVPTWGVFPNKALQGGGPLIDIGTHALDITLWCMNNYKPVSVMGSVYEKLGHSELATQGNMFGPWDPATYEVEDSAFGYIKMENGATIFLESSWAINMLDSKEASATLCGTIAGAELRSGMSYKTNQLVYCKTDHGMLTEQYNTASGNIAFFEGSDSAPEVVECKQWLNAIINDTELLVKPEEAFTVTKILDAVYKSAATKHEVTLA